MIHKACSYYGIWPDDLSLKSPWNQKNGFASAELVEVSSAAIAGLVEVSPMEMSDNSEPIQHLCSPKLSKRIHLTVELFVILKSKRSNDTLFIPCPQPFFIPVGVGRKLRDVRLFVSV